MARAFSPATAEQVVAAVEAVVVNREATDVQFVAQFSDLTTDQARSALELAGDLGLLRQNAGHYESCSPLCRFLATPNQKQKAAVLRVLLESYGPFVVFRERLVATGVVGTAAQQTKVTLDLDAHREGIKDTLISLGTYSEALITEGGGRYSPEVVAAENILAGLMQACHDAAAAEARVRTQLGGEAAAIVSRDEVILPLADGLIRTRAGDPQGAVVLAGNAVESYLEGVADRLKVALTGATGINAKLEKLAAAKVIPKKLLNMGKYLGHIRNAADHGVDAEVGASWIIRDATGLEYVFVACSFVAGLSAREKGRPPEI